MKGKLIMAGKFSILILLMIAIAILVILQWKSEMIVSRVMDSLQGQLSDSLIYEKASIDWISHFPYAGIHIAGLKLGAKEKPFLDRGSIDVVIGLLPLLSNKIIINHLLVQNSTIYIQTHNNRWSYEIFKPSGETSGKSFQTSVKQLILEDVELIYDDGEKLNFDLSVSKAVVKGHQDEVILVIDLDLQGEMRTLSFEKYSLPESFPVKLTANYTYEFKTDQQTFKNWKFRHEGIELELGGVIRKSTGYDMVDLTLSWIKGRPEIVSRWLPPDVIGGWDDFILTGISEGQIKIEGKSALKETPHILCMGTIQDAGLEFKTGAEQVKGLRIDIDYDNGRTEKRKAAQIKIGVSKSAIRGEKLEGKITVTNPDKPVIDATIKGSLPVTLLNLVASDAIRFEKGALDLRHFEMREFRGDKATLVSFLQKTKTDAKSKDIHFTYAGNRIQVADGEYRLDHGKIEFQADRLTWNKAITTALKGSLEVRENKMAFQMNGILCQGKVEAQGQISGMDRQPTILTQGKVEGIDMKQLFESFSNFDQTFITAGNISGKANIWASIDLPMDEKWNILTRRVKVKSAMDIHDGRLSGMKTLEDFSKYVHLDDLRDIRFSQLRNYMKIEDGKVYLPVMFIQSSAINLSISGVHSFDHQILYNVKLNAGQAASQKLKKADVRKELKQSRKSGWINMYFVLEGTTSAVRYQQYRMAVISGFEQSAALKENLRQELVERFGYEVYWLEPNEWEDIPEYK